MVSRGGFFFLLIVALISFKDVFSNTHHHDEDEHDEKADFRREFGDEDTAEEEHEHLEVREPTSFDGPPKILKDLPTLKFLFCVSCGYRQAFDQFSAFIKEKYPNMNIEGGNYPAVAWKSVLAQFVGFVRIAAMVALIANVNPFERVGVATPSIWLWAQNNKMVACLSFFLICNTIEAPLISTGAFEIYLGDAQIWSKLESGRVPSPSELAHIIDSQLELTGKAGGLPTQGFQTLQE